MATLKLILRGFAWQRISLAGRRFCFCPTAITLNNGNGNTDTLKIQSCHRIETNTNLRSQIASGHVFGTGRISYYSTDISSKNANSSMSIGKDESSEPEENESSSSEELVSQSQTGEPLPSEQDQSDWNSKLDKLYKVIELEVLAYEPTVLDSYQWFVLTTATHLGIKVGKCWSPLKSDKLRFPLLKSAFVHKKHQVHYEVRTHHRFLTFHKLTSSTADTFLEYIERNLPEGVGLKVTRVEAKALPVYLQRRLVDEKAQVL